MEPLELLPIPLLQWYRENARVLPWRSDPTPYHVWISEIMLQQTRVAAVLDYYRRFLAELPTVADLAAVEEDRLMKLWQGLGYYNRARNLQKAARQIMEDHGGVFPDTYEAIHALSGIGDYTAGAISSIAFGIPEPAVDGNVLRVVARITGDDGDIMKPDTKARMGAALKRVMPVDAPGDFNQALMELGATVCLPNGAPLCDQCPAKEFCVARLTERTGELPVKAAKKARRVEERTVWGGGPPAAEEPGPAGGAVGVPQRALPRPLSGGGPLPGAGTIRQAHFYPYRVAYEGRAGPGGRRYPARGLGVGHFGGTGPGLCCAQRLSGFQACGGGAA